MAFRDSWHKALVYFGLAEERHASYDDEPEDFEPEQELQESYRERPNVRRLSTRRRRDDFDDIFADEPAGRPTAVLRPVGGGGSGGGRPPHRDGGGPPPSAEDKSDTQ